MAPRYNAPPAMQIDPNKRYEAVFHTQRGDSTVELFTKQAPISTNNFVFLAGAREDYA
ncbi:MAG TPA: hypothetical protein VGP82_02245 [Ktedonobacterales bacterium]|nr:hypothetical protein [Ktedonobacterales bacterium]